MNLVEIDASKINTQNDFNSAAHAASYFATLQAGYTDFHYLREEWKINTEEDALIGVGITGIASGNLEHLDLEEAANVVISTNHFVANLIGINPASRCTTVKPSGTSSLVLGTSSGIHAWYAPYYIRRVRYNRMEPFVPYLEAIMPKELFEPELADPINTVVLSVPVKAPEEAIFREEGAIALLNRVYRYNKEWIGAGYLKGKNHNNVSCTVNVKEDEWDGVFTWMWKHREMYNGISLLPYYDSKYKQLPFEEIDEATYEYLMSIMPEFDISGVVELDDGTDFGQEIACAGGVCEIV